MAEYEVTPGDPIDFGASGTAEILQNVRMILSTPVFSVPMIRDFAWNPEIDGPINVVKVRQASRIAAALRTYEPRAQLVSVTFQADALNGVLKPIAKVRVVSE